MARMNKPIWEYIDEWPDGDSTPSLLVTKLRDFLTDSQIKKVLWAIDSTDNDSWNHESVLEDYGGYSPQTFIWKEDCTEGVTTFQYIRKQAGIL
jgi:hypothetical protein